MKHVGMLFSCAVLLLAFSSCKPGQESSATDPQKSTARVFAEQAAAKLLNPESFTQFVHKDAEHKGQGPGSALRMIARQSQMDSEKILVKETLFFMRKDIPALAKRFPDDMWDADRIPRFMEDGQGCLVVLEREGREGTRPEEALLCAFVVKQVNGDHKIVYVDDN